MAKIPIGNVKGVGIKEITFTSSTGGELPGIAGATDTYTITYTDDTISTYKVYNGKDGADGFQIDDAAVSDKTGWSSSKIDSAKQNNLTIPDSSKMTGDFNDITENGFYTIGDPSVWENIPFNGHGMLAVFCSEDYIIQMYMRSSDGATSVPFCYIRMWNGTRWWDWTAIRASTADVAVTPITTLASGVTQLTLSGSGNSHYQVVNGICYFQLYVTVQEVATEFFDALTGLPKPKANTFFTAAPYANADTFAPIRVNISTGGTMRISHGVVGGMFMITGSYPVAST